MASFTSLAAPVAAGDFYLSFPVDCTLGTDCFIQQYVDRDAGPDATDFNCGPLSYDGHTGTDFALYNNAAITQGVSVLAAAGGVVTGLRDGEPDTGVAGLTSGKECGNGVAIDHGDGWSTQYCHLKSGSIQVAPNEVVEAGAVLGKIGLSGQTEFPHVHVSLRRNGTVVDPFAPASETGCSSKMPASLWDNPIPYQPGGILTLALFDTVPSFDAVKAGTVATLSPDTATPALVLYTHMFGTRAGDTLSFRMTYLGEVVFADTAILDRTQARSFRAFGRRKPDGGWPQGTYTGSAVLSRDGTVISEGTIAFDVQ